MKIASLVLGIIAIIGAVIGFFPCLGWFNWLNLPVAVVGLIISIVATTKDDGESKGMCITGIVLCGLAILIGIIRLIIGVGVL